MDSNSDALSDILKFSKTFTEVAKIRYHCVIVSRNTSELIDLTISQQLAKGHMTLAFGGSRDNLEALRDSYWPSTALRHSYRPSNAQNRCIPFYGKQDVFY